MADRILADLLGLLAADPTLTQRQIAEELGVYQPTISMVMARHGVRRRCDGCGELGVRSSHACPDVRLSITVRSRLGSLLWHEPGATPVTVSDLGLGVRPVLVQCGAAQLVLSREEATSLATIVTASSDLDRLSAALRTAGRGAA